MKNKTVNHIAKILEEHPELQGSSVIDELTPLQEELDKLYETILENQNAFGTQAFVPAIEESPIRSIWQDVMSNIKIPEYKPHSIQVISTPYCPEDKFYMNSTNHDDHIDAHMRYFAMMDIDWFFDEDDEEELKNLGLSSSEIDKLSEHIEKHLGEDSQYNDPKYDKYDLEKLKEKQKHCWHKWELVGTGPVTGEEWWDCKLCGISKEQHEKNKKK